MKITRTQLIRLIQEAAGDDNIIKFPGIARDRQPIKTPDEIRRDIQGQDLEDALIPHDDMTYREEDNVLFHDFTTRDTGVRQSLSPSADDTGIPELDDEFEAFLSGLESGEIEEFPYDD